MAKNTPSDKRFRVAGVFSRKLHAKFREGIKCVFVVGSVAAGLAKPNSDLDLVVIYDQSKADIDKLIRFTMSNAPNKTTVFKIPKDRFETFGTKSY